MKFILLPASLLFAVFIFTGCEKQPIADFTSSSYYYHAGETIHLKNTSLDAESYKWTAPDGNTYTTQDLDYNSDVNDTSSTLKFTLEVFSKKGKKSNSVTKSVQLKQAILPTDFYSVGGTVYKPNDKSLNKNSFYWWIEASISTSNSVFIEFNGTNPPAAGTYSVTDYSPSPGQAEIQIKDATGYHYSNTGTLTVTVPSAGIVRAVFTNLPDYYNSSILLSGDITVR